MNKSSVLIVMLFCNAVTLISGENNHRNTHYRRNRVYQENRFFDVAFAALRRIDQELKSMQQMVLADQRAHEASLAQDLQEENMMRKKAFRRKFRSK